MWIVEGNVDVEEGCDVMGCDVMWCAPCGGVGLFSGGRAPREGGAPKIARPLCAPPQ